MTLTDAAGRIAVAAVVGGGAAVGGAGAEFGVRRSASLGACCQGACPSPSPSDDAIKLFLSCSLTLRANKLARFSSPSHAQGPERTRVVN
jgi:hypothetical protein